MSDNVLQVIPTDPTWIPDQVDAVAPQHVLSGACPEAEEVTANRYDEIRFIDQGENFVAVRCPHCDEELPMEWWQAQWIGPMSTSSPTSRS